MPNSAAAEALGSRSALRSGGLKTGDAPARNTMNRRCGFGKREC